MASEPLKFDSLPPLTPPEGLWDAISRDLDAAEHKPARTPRRFAWPLAAAAMVAIAAIAVVLRSAPGPVDAVADEAEYLADLQTVSAALEADLAQHRFGVVNATTADALARIQQELAWLDVQIAADPDDSALWIERVALLGELNERYRRSDWQSELRLAHY